jgi:hypothetical protein
LAAVGIALNDGIKQPKAALGRIADLAGEKNSAGAGAEDGLPAAEILKLFKKVQLLKKAENGSGFSAREQDGIERGQIFGLADLDGRGAGAGKGLGVRGVISLYG